MSDDTLEPGPKRLADIMRRALDPARPKRTREEYAALEAKWKADEATQRARHASEMAARYPEHLRACKAPERAIAALTEAKPLDTPALQVARRWMDEGKPFLVLSGWTGTGKTVAACWCLRAATRVETRTGYNLKEWDSHAGLFVRLSQLRRLSDFDTGDRALWHRALTARVLVLDEVGLHPGETLSRRAQEDFEELIDRRDGYGRRTILTTNLSLHPEVRDDGEKVSDFGLFVRPKALSRLSRGLVHDCGKRDLRREGGQP